MAFADMLVVMFIIEWRRIFLRQLFQDGIIFSPWVLSTSSTKRFQLFS